MNSSTSHFVSSFTPVQCAPAVQWAPPARRCLTLIRPTDGRKKKCHSFFGQVEESNRPRRWTFARKCGAPMSWYWHVKYVTKRIVCLRARQKSHRRMMWHHKWPESAFHLPAGGICEWLRLPGAERNGCGFFSLPSRPDSHEKADDVPGVTTDKLAYTKVPSDLLAKFVW